MTKTHSSITNKQTNKQFWSENENSIFHASKFDSLCLNQWWKTFLSSVVEAKTRCCLWRIWGCRGWNFAMDFFWVVKLPPLHDAQLWIVFSFKYHSMALCIILDCIIGFQLVSISVSFYCLSIELYTQDLVKFMQHRLFQDIFFKMAGSGLAPASEDVRSFSVLWSRSKDYAY